MHNARRRASALVAVGLLAIVFGGSGALSTLPPATAAGTPPFIYSPYEDVLVGTDWATGRTGLRPGAAFIPLTGTAGVTALAPGTSAFTLAFATGECGSETWGGAAPTAVLQNTSQLAAAATDYVIAVGGAAGVFSCGTDAGMETFLQRYAGPHLAGFDFDIEAGYTQDQIRSLVQRIATAQAKHPDLRFSFTLSTLGAPSGAGLNSYYGDTTMRAIAETGLSDYTVNLMTMDYGATPSGQICVVVDGLCDMGKSAIQAARNLNSQYGVPYPQIELTPMIGMNDVTNEITSLEDIDEMTDFVTDNSLAGFHFWSLDRDAPCAGATAASPTCSGLDASVAGILDFTRRAAASFTTAPPVPVPVTIGAALPAAGTVGEPFSFAVPAAGDGPITFAITGGALPDGVSLNAASGLISGTPRASGTTGVTVRASNPAGSFADARYTVVVAAAPVEPRAVSIGGDTPADATAGDAFAFTVPATGDGPIRFAVTGGALPLGLQLGALSGTISGRPMLPGVSTMTITATGPASSSAAKRYTITVLAAPERSEPIVIGPALPSIATAGEPFTFAVPASGGTGGLRYAVTAGTLPGGMSLDATSGRISGTASDVGASTVTVTVNDAGHLEMSAEYTIAVVGTAAPARTSTPNPQVDPFGPPTSTTGTGRPLPPTLTPQQTPEGADPLASTGYDLAVPAIAATGLLVAATLLLLLASRRGGRR